MPASDIESGAIEGSSIGGLGKSLEVGGENGVLFYDVGVGIVGDASVPVEEFSAVGGGSGEDDGIATIVSTLKRRDGGGAEDGVVAVDLDGVGNGGVGGVALVGFLGAAYHYGTCNQHDAKQFDYVFHFVLIFNYLIMN